MDLLGEHKQALFGFLKARWESLFEARFEVLLHDLTSTYFECDPPEEGKRRYNFRVMPGADWLALLCRHIPDRFEHLVRYAGWYSNRARGKRRRMGAAALGVAVQEADAPTASRARSTWARLIHKVYEVDPLECPKCKGPMRVISLIEDSDVIRRMLQHLGL